VDIYPIDRLRWGDARHGGEVAAGQAGRPDAADKPAQGRFAELGNRRWFARALAQREVDLEAVRHLVGRFIAPSRFLLERFVAAGWPREKLVHADYGFPPAGAARSVPGGGLLRAGFVGTLSDYKGVEVFAGAVARLPPGTPLRATIHGHLDWFPDVSQRLAALAARAPALTLAGPFEAARRDEVLGALDLLVVPSLWWENSPLTIHEAWQRGLPVLASERGGMAELLAQGGGATFPPGDEAALAGLLARAAREPALLASWRASIPPVRDIAQDVQLIEELARELGASAGDGGPAAQ
jgi:glycosyltransferase involved in cell wall biosynthesis